MSCYRFTPPVSERTELSSNATETDLDGAR